MKLCLVGKFPPIAGGVSTRTYAYAHALAQCGHEVHVITNADEAEPPYRMFMRDEDWRRCAGDSGRGKVRVHWTDRFDRRQFHIPPANPFVTKLASLGIEVARAEAAELVFSFYAEPYAVAGHLIAQASGLPHVVRLAGSDAGRLWSHPQFRPLYDHVFRAATMILAGGAVANALEDIGIPRERLRPDRAYRVDEDRFSPDGPALDVEELLKTVGDAPVFAGLCLGRLQPGLRYFGVYGKLGPRKGTAPLLRALAMLKAQGLDAGLLVMGHAAPHDGEDYDALSAKLGIADRIVRLPFLPNWRVPEFIRRCLAVCCLEQDFPIAGHAPIVAREVMTCGACIVASTEMLRKLPYAERVIHGYNAIAVSDANDAGEIARQLAGILERPELAPAVGARACRVARDYQRDVAFPAALERTLSDALAMAEIPRQKPARPVRRRPARAPVTEDASTPAPGRCDPLFRLSVDGGALMPGRLASLVPTIATEIEIAPTGAPPGSAAELQDAGFAQAVIDGEAASILGLCDGVRTVADIAVLMGAAGGVLPEGVADRVLALFELGVLSLTEPRRAPL